MAVIGAVAQAMFSEQILSRWLRVEWFWRRCNDTYKTLHALFQSAPARPKVQAKVLESFAFYEARKANAGHTSSESIFLRMNPSLSTE